MTTDPSRVLRTPERLTRRADYLAAGRGRRFHTSRMTLQGAPRDAAGGDVEGPRFGLTVSRKVGSAVERNRVKRRLRAALRHLAGGPTGLPGLPHFDYVLVARRDILSADFERLVLDVVQGVAGVHRPKPGNTDRTRKAAPAGGPQMQS
jgi:ribonuclease P protein component